MRDYKHLKPYQFKAKDPRVAIPILKEYGDQTIEFLKSKGWDENEAERGAVGAIMKKTGYSHVTAKNILKYGRTTL